MLQLAVLGLLSLRAAALATPKTAISYRNVSVGGGISLSTAVAGTGDEPMVLFHGFPEASWFWRGMVDPLLKDTSLTLYMPDLRGFNTSSKPPGIDQYNISFLVADAVGLIKAVGGGSANKVHVVGHDWGGMMVAWFVAGRHPELVKTLTILNAPHPSVFDALIRSDPTEQRRSSYQFYFDSLASNKMDTSTFFNKDAWWDPATAAAYAAAYAADGPGPGLNWYRANIFGGRLNVTKFTSTMVTNFPKAMVVTPPTLVLWGMKDGAFDDKACLAGLAPLVPNLKIKTAGYENVSHWIAQEAPVLVASDIRAFVAASRATTTAR